MSRPMDYVGVVSRRNRLNGIRRIAAAAIMVVRMLIGCGLVALPGDEAVPKKLSGVEVAHASLDHALKALQNRLNPSSRGTHGKH